jgi:hypothetical protein
LLKVLVNLWRIFPRDIAMHFEQVYAHKVDFRLVVSSASVALIEIISKREDIAIVIERKGVVPRSDWARVLVSANAGVK